MSTHTHLPIDPPGRILLEEYLEPMNLTQKAVSTATGIPYVRLKEGKFACYTRTSVQYL